MARKGDAIPAGAWPRLLTEHQAADYLGVSVNTFRGLSGAPRPLRLGDLTAARYDKDDLDAYIDACKRGRQRRRGWRLAKADPVSHVEPQ